LTVGSYQGAKNPCGTIIKYKGRARDKQTSRRKKTIGRKGGYGMGSAVIKIPETKHDRKGALELRNYFYEG